MSNLPRRRFGPGHTVSIGVSVKHTMHIDRAIAVFAHEQEDGVWLNLVGSPQLYDREHHTPEELEAWRSEAEMVLTIPARPVPGVYTLSHVILETCDGRFFRYDREELGAADGFASFYTVNEEGKDPAIVAAMLFDEIARRQGDPTIEQFASDHPITQQRVYNFLCLLEGSDPENLHGPLVDEGYLPESRAPLCPMESAWLNYGWWTVLESHITEAFKEQGTEAQEQARDQLIAENEAFAEEIQKIRTAQ